MLVVCYSGTLGSVILSPVRSDFAYRICAFAYNAVLINMMRHFRGAMRPPSGPSEARRARRPTSVMRHFKGTMRSMVAAAKKSPHRRYYSFDHPSGRVVKHSHSHHQTPPPKSYNYSAITPRVFQRKCGFHPDCTE